MLRHVEKEYPIEFSAHRVCGSHACGRWRTLGFRLNKMKQEAAGRWLIVRPAPNHS